MIAGELDLKAIEPEDRYAYFQHAAFSDLGRCADTTEASGLVTALSDELCEHLMATGRWKNKRGAVAMEKVHCCVAAFVGDLLAAPGWGSWGGLVCRSMRNNDFSGTDVTGDLFRAVLAYLKDAGLVEHFRGFHVATEWGEDTVKLGKTMYSRFRATPRLLALAEAHGVLMDCAEDHFPLPARATLMKPQLRLKSAKSRQPKGRERRGAAMPVRQTPEVTRIKADLDAICTFLATVNIEGVTYRGLFRQFEHGDDPQFRWNKGGRLYTFGKDGYQQQKKAARLAIRLNGEPVVEIDLRASYLTILHALLDRPLTLDPDPYALPGIERSVVKTWITASITKGSPVRKWAKRHKEEYAKEYPGRDLAKVHPAASLEFPVGRKHPVLKDIGALGISWADLMYLESEVIVRTMLDLVAEGVPSLPVHDSLIVPQSSEARAEGLLEDHFQSLVGRTPFLDTRRPSTP